MREVPTKEAEAIRQKDREKWAVQERLIDVLCMQDRRVADPGSEMISQERVTYMDRAAKMGHLTEKRGTHYYCLRCGQSWRPKDTKRFTLMNRGECLGIAMYSHNIDLNRPWTLPSGMRVQVGKGRTHRTHRLCWYKRVFYCRRCDHYGQENRRILNLVKECYEPPRQH